MPCSGFAYCAEQLCHLTGAGLYKFTFGNILNYEKHEQAL